jgi:hypothetical protein
MKIKQVLLIVVFTLSMFELKSQTTCDNIKYSYFLKTNTQEIRNQGVDLTRVFCRDLKKGTFNFSYQGKEFYLTGLEPYSLTPIQERLGDLVIGYTDFNRTDNLDVRVLFITKIDKTKKTATEGIRTYWYVYMGDVQFIFEIQ